MRWRFPVIAVVLAVAIADADDDSEDAAPHATLVAVRGRLDGTTAVLDVRYRLAFDRATYEPSALQIDLPDGAVATRAVVTAGSARHVLALTRAEAAEKAFVALGDAPPGRARRWGVQITGDRDALTVSLATPRAGALTLDIELHVPTCFYRDARYVRLPSDWTARTSAPIRVRAGAANDLYLACTREPEPDDSAEWIGFADPALAARPGGVRRVGVDGAAAMLDGTHVARLSIDIAGRLGEIPRELATVIVVDGSRSVTANERIAQRALVAAYLRAAPASHVQVVAYDRHARALLPSWRTASSAATSIARALETHVPRNGSNIDAGLAEAGRWLARFENRGAARRVLLVTDELVPASLENAAPGALAALLPAGTLVHVAALEDYETSPERDDDVVFAGVAAVTGGMAVRTGVPGGDAHDVTALLRATSLDNISITAHGWTELDHVSQRRCDESLTEGATCTWWAQSETTAGPILVEGDVWGERVVRVLQPSPSHSLQVARELSVADNVPPDLANAAQIAAHAANNAWSLYGEWGGKAGYTDMMVMVGSCCGRSMTSGHTIGIGTITPRPPPPPLDLEPQLAASVDRCKLGTRVVEATIETTRSEIVGVVVTASPRDTVLEHCVSEAIWDATLHVADPYVRAVTRATFGD